MGIDGTVGRYPEELPEEVVEVLLVEDSKSQDKGTGGVCKMNPQFPTLPSRFIGVIPLYEIKHKGTDTIGVVGKVDMLTLVLLI